MKIETLRERTRQALRDKSLRELAALLGVSHETVRTLALGTLENMTVKIYCKIDKGLARNGY